MPVSAPLIGAGFGADNAIVSPGMPSGYAVGTPLLAVGVVRHPTATVTISAATGWSAPQYIRNGTATNGPTIFWSWKTATSTSETAPQFTPVGAATGATVIATVTAWPGAGTATPFVAGTGSGTLAASANIGPVPGVTIPAGGAAFLVGAIGDDTATAPATPTGWTIAPAVAGTATVALGASLECVAGTDASLDFYYQTSSAGTTTSAATWDANSTANATAVGVQFIVNPAPTSSVITSVVKNATSGSSATRPLLTSASAGPPLARWNTALAGQATAPAKILNLGNSVTEGQGASTRLNRWVEKLRDLVRSRSSISGGGEGYTPFRFFTYAPDSTWSKNYTSFTGTEPEAQNWVGNLGYRISLMNAAGSFTRSFSGTDVDIWYVLGGGGVFSYKIDGAAAVQVNTDGTYGNAKTSVTGLSAGAHTITITWVSGTVYLSGMTVWSGDKAAGINAFEGGHSGFKVSDVLADSALSVAAWNTVSPDLVTVEYGLNELGGGVTAATFQTNLQSLVDSLKGLTKVPSILIVAAYRPSSDPTNAWPSYVTAMQNVATASGVGFLDLSATMPQATTAGTGYYSTDGLHPSDAGHAFIATAVADVISPVSGSSPTLATETWTGTNGASWPAQWTTSTLNGSAATIQGNLGQMTTPTSGAYLFGARAYLSGMAATTDFDLTVDVSFTALTEAYYFIGGRCVDGSGSSPNGYYVEIFPSNGSFSMAVVKGVGGTDSTISGDLNGGQWVANTARRVRFQGTGSNLKVKVWDPAASEPSTWLWEGTDTTYAALSGKALIYVISGGAADAKSMRLDNFTITNGASGATSIPATVRPASASSSATRPLLSASTVAAVRPATSSSSATRALLGVKVPTTLRPATAPSSATRTLAAQLSPTALRPATASASATRPLGTQFSPTTLRPAASSSSATRALLVVKASLALRPATSSSSATRPLGTQFSPATLRPAIAPSSATRPVLGIKAPLVLRPATASASATRPVLGVRAPLTVLSAASGTSSTRPLASHFSPAGVRPSSAPSSATRPLLVFVPATGVRPATSPTSAARPLLAVQVSAAVRPAASAASASRALLSSRQGLPMRSAAAPSSATRPLATQRTPLVVLGATAPSSAQSPRTYLSGSVQVRPSTSASSATRPVLAQRTPLAVLSAGAGATAARVSAGQRHVATVRPASAPSSASRPLASAVGSTTVRRAFATPSITRPLMAQRVPLTVLGARADTTATQVGLGQRRAITVAGARSETTASRPLLTALGHVAVRPAVAPSRATRPVLTQRTSLAVLGARAEATATRVLLDFVVLLDVQAATATTSVEAVLPTHHSILTVRPARAPAKAERVVLPGSVWPTAPTERTFLVGHEDRVFVVPSGSDLRRYTVPSEPRTILA